MKHLTKIWSMALLFTATVFMVSCGEDDEPVIEVGEGLEVADGLYLVIEGEDPVASMQLTPEQVEADEFGAQEREGFLTGYFYLSAGNYNLVQTVDREIAATVGGSIETIAYDTIEVPLTYQLVDEATDGGEAFALAEGLYKIAHDDSRSEIVIFPINRVALIGEATPNGGNNDTPLSGSANAEGASWTASDIILRSGWYKFRFNSTWNIDRRIDPAAGLGAENGYLMFTNFGGDINNLSPGNVGGNFEMTADNAGVYSVEVSFNSDNGFAFSQNKTGDVEPITFVPEENRWAVVGAATEFGWPGPDCGVEGEDVDMTYEGLTNGTHTWTVEVTLAADQFKFRPNDCWDDGELNFGNTTIEGPAAGNISNPENGNMSNDVAATYNITLTTSNDGESYIANFEVVE